MLAVVVALSLIEWPPVLMCWLILALAVTEVEDCFEMLPPQVVAPVCLSLQAAVEEACLDR